MANSTALALLLLFFIVASAHTTVAERETVLRDRRTCIAEIAKMDRWPCKAWLVSEYAEGDSSKLLQPCCDELNSLSMSSNCHCEAIWELRKTERVYGDLACKLPEQCGFTLCLSCPNLARLDLAA